MGFLLFVHIAGAVIFLGNIITAAFWKVRADVKKDCVLIHNTAKNVMLADYVFTLPGLILLVVSGSLMAAQAGMLQAGMNWLMLSLILFGLTGIIWLAILIPLQRSMIRLSAISLQTGVISGEYKKASLYWAIFGIAASLLPLVVLYLMVSKPF